MNEINDIKKTVGLTIATLRKNKGLTQEKLAEYMDMEPGSIAQIENGTNFLSCETLSKLVEIFEVAPSFFFMKNPNTDINDIDFIKEIKQILPTLSKERLKDIYNIILLFQK